jgi:glutamate/tyrosine decarboxylase-like PLP-dependent enzyme
MPENMNGRNSPIEMKPEEFRNVGYKVVDKIADFLDSLSDKPVSPGKTVAEIKQILGNNKLPLNGTSAEKILEEAANLLFNYTTFNGHPKFWGYITSSATPIGSLADMLASSANPNVGAWGISPIATEIEAQTIRWIAEMIGYPQDCGGLMVSGGNMANFVGFLSGHRAKVNWDVRKEGIQGNDNSRLIVYASTEAHTWIQKAADLFGLGTDAIHWISIDDDQRMNITELEMQIKEDIENGYSPFMVVGTAGSVALGVVDPLQDIYNICKKFDLWFHVDGAYGAFAAALTNPPDDLESIRLADSIALDPHKWLYSPLEAGCTIVKKPEHLIDAFSYHPPYYRFEEDDKDAINYYEHGFQNSRGFRALKVWLGLRQVGKNGYVQMISDDIKLAKHLYNLADSNAELQAFTNNLSVTTFRYVPSDLKLANKNVENYLDKLNQELLDRLQNSGEAYLSNAILNDTFLLRACVVNFRSTIKDIEALPEIVIRIGKEIDSVNRPSELK